MTDHEAPQSIRELHDDYRQGRSSVADVVTGYLSRMSSRRDLGAYLSEFPEAAHESAARMDAQLKKTGLDHLIAQHPIWGVPVAIKDNLHVAGEVTTCGSKLLESYRAPFDATSVKRLAASGAILLGKQNLIDPQIV